MNPPHPDFAKIWIERLNDLMIRGNAPNVSWSKKEYLRGMDYFIGLEKKRVVQCRSCKEYQVVAVTEQSEIHPFCSACGNLDAGIRLMQQQIKVKELEMEKLKDDILVYQNKRKREK